MVRQTVFFTGFVLLAACSTVRGPVEPADSGPAAPVDVSHIPNAKPAPVVRTRAGNAKTYQVYGKTYRILESSQGYQERGLASWYGTKFHGRRTANGEVYDMFGMTAAHKTLPIPSYVRVTHVGNGKSVIVRVNDRGPFHGDRVIDLSYAAARKLGVDTAGVALVDIVDVTPVSGQQAYSQPQNQGEPVQTLQSTSEAVSLPSIPKVTPKATPKTTAQPLKLPPKPPVVATGANLYLQLGAFRQLPTAQSLQSRVAALLSYPVKVFEGEDKLHRVAVGPIANERQVFDLQRILQEGGFDIGYIVRKHAP